MMLGQCYLALAGHHLCFNERDGLPGSNKGIFTAKPGHSSSVGTLQWCACCPPPPLPPFLLMRNLSLKDIAGYEIIKVTGTH